jgi:hypothetical protein
MPVSSLRNQHKNLDFYSVHNINRVRIIGGDMFFNMHQSFFGTMREDKATIIETGAGYVRIAFNSSCRNESQCHGCTLCASSPSVIKLRIRTANSGQFCAGQPVKIKRIVVHETISALMLFGLPLALAFAAVFISPYADSIPDNPVPSAIAAAIGLAGGFAIAFISDICVRRKYPPEIITNKNNEC